MTIYVLLSGIWEMDKQAQISVCEMVLIEH